MAKYVCLFITSFQFGTFNIAAMVLRENNIQPNVQPLLIASSPFREYFFCVVES